VVIAYVKGKTPDLEEIKAKIREYLGKWGKVGSATIMWEGYPKGLVLKAMKEMEADGEVELIED